MFLLSAFALPHQAKHTFEIAHGQFLLDGKPTQIIAGEMHYPRIPEAYWRHRIKMAKAMGLNAISIYCFWNYHETEPGKFDFKGNADVAKFVRICQEEGMWAILRPGPYVCAEWEFGGYPYWLLNVPGCVVRKDNQPFLNAASRFMNALGKQLAPLQVTRGGNILMVQVENEYGSFGSDKVFMGKTRQQVRDAGFDVPLFTADGESQMPAGRIDGALPGWNGGGFPQIKKVVDKFQPGGPYFVPEFYPGWLCHWGETFPRSNGQGATRGVEELVRGGASVTLYMFHGGTNFGFWNGANYGGKYEPHITSYDYDAPCDESGRATQKYMMFRDMLTRNLPNATIPSVPPANPVVTVPRFKLNPVASILDLLGRPKRFDDPQPMERLGQGYGFVMYRHTLTGSGRKQLTIDGVRDYAVVMVNGKTVGTLDRRRKERTIMVELLGDKDINIDILVENGGRINYGRELLDNLKGITGRVSLDGKELKGWQHFSLPFASVPKTIGHPTEKSPTVYAGQFELKSIGDTFLDMRGWNKGIVWINGHNLGRYFKIGPQQTLYVPGPWLRTGVNDISIFEEIPTGQSAVEAIDHSILDEAVPEPVITVNRARMDRTPAVETTDKVASGEFAKGNAWQIVPFKSKTGRYFVFDTLSSHANETFSSCAELELIGADGKTLPRNKWKIAFCDSEETLAENGAAENMIDGDPETIWHSVWSQPHKGHPHRVIIDLGAQVTVAGCRYLPRQGGEHPAMTKGYAMFVCTKV